MKTRNDRMRYFRIGEFAASMMLKGIIHPDMQEANLKTRNSVVVTCDFGDIKRFHFPEKIDKKIVRQLIDALFPPMENILKDFELMSFFRAGFLSIGGMFGKHIFDGLDDSGVNSFRYLSVIPEIVMKEKMDDSYMESEKAYYEDWKNAIINILLDPNTGEILINSIQKLMDTVCNENKYYADQLLLLKACESFEQTEENMGFWITALHFAFESVKKGYIYTGYGVLRKVLQLDEKALPVITAYRTKIEEMLEFRNMNKKIQIFIDECTKYDFLQLLWIVNDIDRFMGKTTYSIEL